MPIARWTKDAPSSRSNPEAGHARIGDRQLAALAAFLEERHHAAARADDVAVAHHGEARAALASQVVGRDEQLVRAQFGGAVEIDRADRLVGGERNHSLDALVQAGVDDVLGADDVGLDAFNRVVFGGGHLLEGGRVNHDIDALESAFETVAVAHVADEEAQLTVREALRHLVLLELVARIDDDAGGPMLGEQPAHECLAERAGAAGHQYRSAIE